MRRSTVLRSLVAAALAACLPVAIVLTLAASHRGPDRPPAPGRAALARRGPASRLTAAHRAFPDRLPDSGLIATAAAPLHWSHRPGGVPAGALAATNPYGQPETLAVVGRPGNGWAEVELPLRPNGQLGWVPLSSVRLTWTPYSVAVSLEARTVTVYRGRAVVMSAPAAVGAPSTYTPKGRTYLWELIKVANPAGAYGPYIFGLAEFSDSYTEFDGGVAQIGLHGTDQPWSIGEAVSHGCIRVNDAVIARLAGMLPLGTPVTIN